MKWTGIRELKIFVDVLTSIASVVDIVSLARAFLNSIEHFNRILHICGILNRSKTLCFHRNLFARDSVCLILCICMFKRRRWQTNGLCTIHIIQFSRISEAISTMSSIALDELCMHLGLCNIVHGALVLLHDVCKPLCSVVMIMMMMMLFFLFMVFTSRQWAMQEHTILCLRNFWYDTINN